MSISATNISTSLVLVDFKTWTDVEVYMLTRILVMMQGIEGPEVSISNEISSLIELACSTLYDHLS